MLANQCGMQITGVGLHHLSDLGILASFLIGRAWWIRHCHGRHTIQLSCWPVHHCSSLYCLLASWGCCATGFVDCAFYIIFPSLLCTLGLGLSLPAMVFLFSCTAGPEAPFIQACELLRRRNYTLVRAFQPVIQLPRRKSYQAFDLSYCQVIVRICQLRCCQVSELSPSDQPTCTTSVVEWSCYRLDSVWPTRRSILYSGGRAADFGRLRAMP